MIRRPRFRARTSGAALFALVMTTPARSAPHCAADVERGSITHSSVSASESGSPVGSAYGRGSVSASRSAPVAAKVARTESVASPESAEAPALAPIHERGASALYSLTLPNGLTAVIDSRPGRRTVYCEIGVRAGSRNEPLELAGMSHLLEHLLFKEGEAPGARKNPAFSRIRAAGGEVNAMTSFEVTTYYCDVHADAFEEGWRGLSNLVAAASFDAKDVDLERKAVLQEAALDKKNPLSVAAYSILDRLFPGDPLSQPVIGFTKTLRRIRFEDVDRYYGRFYVPANAWALVVGDVTPERAARLIEETLGAWGVGEVAPERAARSIADTGSAGGSPHSAPGGTGSGTRGGAESPRDRSPRPAGPSSPDGDSTREQRPALGDGGSRPGAEPPASGAASDREPPPGPSFPPRPNIAGTKRFEFHTFTH